MKRLIIIALLLLGLCGCSAENDVYPRILYEESTWSPFRKISLPDGYSLNDGHSYDIVDTESGYDIVLHFIEE